MRETVFIERGIVGVTPVIAGSEPCEPRHRFGPAVRDYYLIHFVISGKGVFTDPRGTHAVSAGEMFVIRPGELTVYEADARDPWEYAWLGFVCERDDILVSAPSVAKTPDGVGDRLYRLIYDGESAPEIYIALIYELIHALLCSDEGTDTPTDRLRRIHRYIRYNYMRPLSVGELARTFGFERSYLYRIFKERYGVGIKEYITRVRMSKAALLLEEGYSVGEVASMVGYDDPFNFSKAFKAYHGTPPSKYRP